MKKYEDGAFTVNKERRVQYQEQGRYWAWALNVEENEAFITPKGDMNSFETEFIYKKIAEEVPPPRPKPIREPMSTGLYMVMWGGEWVIRVKKEDGSSYFRGGLLHTPYFDIAYEEYQIVSLYKTVEKP